jgi:hypothetical protein
LKRKGYRNNEIILALPYEKIEVASFLSSTPFLLGAVSASVTILILPFLEKSLAKLFLLSLIFIIS